MDARLENMRSLPSMLPIVAPSNLVGYLKKSKPLR
jgi:hypothetical protein